MTSTTQVSDILTRAQALEAVHLRGYAAAFNLTSDDPREHYLAGLAAIRHLRYIRRLRKLQRALRGNGGGGAV